MQFMDPKRIVFGILALVLFGLFLVNMGRMDAVTEVAREVLPGPVEVEAPDVELEDVIADAPITAPIVEEPAAPSSPLGVLDSIPVTVSAADGYDRDLFGQRWADVDRNGCDTRNDILARDLEAETFRDGTNGCVVITGTLADPYTGKQVAFTKEDAGAVPIDHVVALSWAWQNGAHAWDDATRTRFANDPLNLQATTRSANSSKSDHGPAGWLPDNDAYRCAYLARFIQIVDVYELTFAEADRATTRRELATC